MGLDVIWFPNSVLHTHITTVGLQMFSQRLTSYNTKPIPHIGGSVVGTLKLAY